MKTTTLSRIAGFVGGLCFALVGLITGLAAAEAGLAPLAYVSLALALAGCAVMAVATFAEV